MKFNLAFSLCLFFSIILCGVDIKQLEKTSLRSYWNNKQDAWPVSTAEVLDEAIEAARVYYLNQQLTDGNFRYGLDLTDNTEDSDDNMVRQAGALWGLANLNRDRFTEATRRAVLLGIDFFMGAQCTVKDANTKVVTYNGKPKVKTGMVALYCLALVDFLEGQEQYLSEAQILPFVQSLCENLRFLRYLELPDGSWRDEYDNRMPPSKDIPGEASPYFDGEALLCYLFAEQFFKKHPQYAAQMPDGITERIESALPKLLLRYDVETFEPTGDMALAKGFYQWGSMACALYCASSTDRPHKTMAAQAALTMAWWQIYGNHLEYREGNTGYAVEGLVAAYTIAKRLGRNEDADIIRDYTLKIISKLLTWQLGGPYEKYNPFLTYWAQKAPPRAKGGITSGASSGYIRIDIVQHQLHAMLMVRRYILTDEN